MKSQKSPGVTLLNNKPLVIAGPCSAETEEQVMSTAMELKKVGRVDYFRAGIWKPRTRPGTFEGIGTKGLPWLQSVKAETGIPVTVEVANAKQVEDALHFEVDMLWIGARSVVNPASVQEIANALKGSDVPVLIKNPLSPVLDLWTGAVERIRKAGIDNLGLIHRGFSAIGNTQYRNVPMWHLAIQMKKRHPELKMICDPSHIAGKRHLVEEVALKSAELGLEGVMIESHINPDKAWSDAAQQVTPAKLAEILNKLKWNKEDKLKNDITEGLGEYREEINLIDEEHVQLISQRMKLAEKIGEYKKQNNMEILQSERWNAVLQQAIKNGERSGLSIEFMNRLFMAIHLESLMRQKSIEGLKKCD